MDLDLLLFVLLVALGSYVQTVVGFAMGMILIAGSSVLGLYPLPLAAAVVSLLALLNIALALFGHLHWVDRRSFLLLCAGQVLMIGVGVFLLDWLDATAQRMLSVLLGAFILLGCISMMMRPEPRSRMSGAPAFFTVGLCGGLLGGLFSAAAPVMGWFVYRQPMRVAQLRATLLACFAVSTVVRTLIVGVSGGLTRECWVLAAAGVPMVLLSAWLGRRFPPPVSERSLRRMAFTLLFTMGAWIFVSALLSPVRQEADGVAQTGMFESTAWLLVRI